MLSLDCKQNWVHLKDGLQPKLYFIKHADLQKHLKLFEGCFVAEQQIYQIPGVNRAWRYSQPLAFGKTELVESKSLSQSCKYVKPGLDSNKFLLFLFSLNSFLCFA